MTTFPQDTDTYMGAFVLPGKAIPSLSRGPRDWFEIRFLSDNITALVAATCSEAEYDKQSLEEAGFDYLVAEFVLSQCLMVRGGDTVIDEKWGMHRWRWYRNPEGGRQLTAEDKIPNPQLPLCTSKARFASSKN